MTLLRDRRDKEADKCIGDLAGAAGLGCRKWRGLSYMLGLGATLKRKGQSTNPIGWVIGNASRHPCSRNLNDDPFANHYGNCSA